MGTAGFQEGICSLVGSSIGANNVALGKRIAKVTFVISYAWCLFVSLCLYLLRAQVAALFTQDDEVKAVLMQIMTYQAFFYIPDSA